ncbi:Na+/H+ antiporter NhaA [Endothiovibrio diazotrophicus]
MNDNTPASFLAAFFKMESASGILLMAAAVLAMICANTPLAGYYNLFLDTPVAVRIGALEVAKPLLLWINDGLMAIFFFLVGLELKRELIEGELADRRNVILPGIGAIGGMAIPALIYVGLNAHNPATLDGWAIPAATDIAFALGVLTLLGSRVPTSIKIFLTGLAIFDDIGAILIIALFYTDNISVSALTVVALCLPLLALMNWREVESKSLYMVVGIVMWVALLKSGVHATLTGVVLAMFVPIRVSQNAGCSPLKEMEHDLHAMVAFFILPLFAFANAGIDFAGVGVEQLVHPVPTGIALGLFLGKQAGVFGFCWLAIRAGLAKLPDGVSWGTLYGTAVLCGIGFTMSLFIGSLAFEGNLAHRVFDDRLGIVLGSLASGVVGYLVLRATLPRQPT